jgi:ATP-binding cassette subfamily B multidrug efflux pump
VGAGRDTLLWLVLILAASPLLIALQTMFKHQTLAGNFPMLLRWNFHRLMLSQSMSFYQNEFAGGSPPRSCKALAVRDFCMIVGDILVFITIYFATLIGVVGSFDMWMLAPFFVWLAPSRWHCATSCRACRRWRATRPMRAR